MFSSKDSQILPRNGHTLVSGLVARISGCKNQEEVSLDDQVDHGEEVVAEHYAGPAEYRVVATKGKGERLDHPELGQIEAMLRSGELDLLVMEDIGRLVRGAEAVRLCGIAVDHGVRVISPNDCVDTAEDSWEEDVLDACKEHVGHNAHTSKRLKHKLMNRFKKFGGAAAHVPPGYVKPPKEKTDDDTPPKTRTHDDWSQDASLTETIQSGAQLLWSTLNCSVVADWFNQNGMPVGKYARSKQWDGHSVRRFYSNPILKGFPQRGNRHTVKHNETGRRISVPNPKGPSYYEAPHLAHLEPAFFDELNARLKEKDATHARKPVNGTDLRWRVPRKRTRFPGQFATCWYCGRQFVWGGNGLKDDLMCSGARHYNCWNSITFNGPEAVKKLVAVITDELCKLDGFKDQFSQLVLAARNGQADGSTERRRQLAAEAQSLQETRENLIAAIGQFGPRPMFAEKIAELDKREKHLAWERQRLESVRAETIELPDSVTDLREVLEEQFRELALGSPEFGDLMRQLVPEFVVYSVRLCDGGHPRARAKVKLNLGGSIADIQRVPELESLLRRGLDLDLFDPPQRERIRTEAVRLAAEDLTERCIARSLSEKVTQPAVQKALALDRKVKELGLESPYVVLLEPPGDYGRLRRHKHARFKFSMREGYERPSL
jgi:site-specific DNA recombinase